MCIEKAMEWYCIVCLCLTIPFACAGQRNMQNTQTIKIIKDYDSEFVLKCKRESSAVNWRRDGNFLTSEELLLPPYQRTLQIVSHGNTFSIRIRRFRRDDAGLYECVDYYNQVQAAYLVSVTQQVEIAAFTSDITVPENSVVDLWCNASGNPAPSITWYIMDNIHASPIGIEGSKLQIRNVTRRCGTTYRCSATNRVTQGYVNQDIKVAVEYPPEVLGIEMMEGGVCPEEDDVGIALDASNEEELTWDLGDSVSLICHWTASPINHVEWYKLDKNGDYSKIGTLSADRKISYNSLNSGYTLKECHSSETSNAGTLLMKFRITGDSQFTKYKCDVSNKYGQNSFSVTVAKNKII